MKKQKITLLFALAVLLYAVGQSLAVIPTDDAYVHSGNAGTNYGLSSALYVGDENTNTPPIMTRSYLKFTIPATPVGSTIVSAKLKLNINQIGSVSPMPVDVHLVSNDTWSESAITWNTMPAYNATVLDSQTVSNGAQKVWKWDVTSTVISELSGDGVITLMIRDPGEIVQGQFAGFVSKDASHPASDFPDLEITYDNEPSDPILKFQQLPLNGPEYFGHDELSTAYSDPDVQNGFEGCYMADDFADLKDTPVIKIKWWGSYLENEIAEPVTRFLIAFESDIAAVHEPEYIASHPGNILQTEIVRLSSTVPLNPGEYSETPIGPGGAPCNEALYEYEAVLENPFPQDPNTVYWIKIVALIDDPAVLARVKPALQASQLSLCEFLKLSNAQQAGYGLERPVTRWGWHNRDYTIRDPYASTFPAVDPGEKMVGYTSGGNEVWHFQDDAVSGELFINEPSPEEPPIVDQTSWKEEYYVYDNQPLCPPPPPGVDGPQDIVEFSKDLAFELYTEEEEEPDEFDFGDAPEFYLDGTATNYPTTLVNNGANHLIVQSVYLGAFVDAEPDGQPTTPANGDDIDAVYPVGRR